MRNIMPVLITLVAVSGCGYSKIIPVDVGNQGSNEFNPERLDADIGDVVEFRFSSGEHSVAQGNTTMGCYPVVEGGFYSGKQTTPASFRVTINNTDPIMVYSSVDRECQDGMLAFINANRVEEVGYKLTTKRSILNKSPEKVFGGTLSESSHENTGDDEDASVATIGLPRTSRTIAAISASLFGLFVI